MAAEQGYRISNLDSLIMAEQPKMAPVIPQMRQKIADMLGVDITQVGLKAGTMERMGFVGREEGIACQAIAGLVLIK
jgi:2-C-methyl-D-erythritol 2,4-cyclodiphosphate synthase